MTEPLVAPGVAIGAAVVAVLLLIVAALLAAAEAALARLSRSGVAELYAEGRPHADRVARIVADRDAAARGVGFWRLLAEMGAAVAITLALAGVLRTWWVLALAAVAVCVLLVGVIAGVAPRRWGHDRPGRVLHALSGPVAAMTAIARGLRRLLPVKERSAEDRAEDAAEEMREMVDRVSESKTFEEEERDLFQSVFEFGRTLTREVMVPRTDMVTIERDRPLHKAISLFTRYGFSRVPVIGESTDDLVGVLYLKDVMRRVHRRPEAEDLVVADVMREPVFVPETKVVDDLLREMQRDTVHIAMVVDEYGGIAGLVTIEDILEELVGEMVDEHDRAETAVEDLGDGVLRVPARTPIDDLGAMFDLRLEVDDVDTAGGLLAKSLGVVPNAGAEVDVFGLHLQAERVEGRRRRVTTILASRAEQTVGAEES